MISYDGIYLGFAPNYKTSSGSGISMSTINGYTGQKAATYNVYSQIKQDNVDSGSYDGNDQYNTDDIIESGAVLIASLMPEVDAWSDISTGLCASVASFFESTFTSQGVTVWLRFAHEMNYYGDPNGGQFVYPIYSSEFQTAWANMYDAVKSNDKIHMFWSPNYNDSSEPVAKWFPSSADQVDIVGMDYYPNADEGLPTFAEAYGDFYDAYAKAYDIPFALGETGTQLSDGDAASVAQRETWLKAVINPSNGFGDYPLYMSATWFEYGPPITETFYVVYDQSESTIQETISNTENGSA
ncbi:glycoside hydrolase family 26 protein [Acidomyces richmondensis BFW]|nr:MAG: glycoside hydrolase family 26 protein [Acidomyces sp. 'richmondensis']KYG41565.1 glycoside hydrolase family 26 protein [Acidomyces richmondensis BFW]